MPVASRRLLPPRRSSSPGRLWGTLCPLVVMVAAIFCVRPVAAIPIGAFLLLCVLMGIWEWRCQIKAAARRPGESICTFVRGFDYRRTDTRVIRAVYDELQPWYRFPLRASDKFDGELRIDPEDLEFSVLRAVAARTGRSLADAQNNPYFGRVGTVADLVAFLCAQPSVAAPSF